MSTRERRALVFQSVASIIILAFIVWNVGTVQNILANNGGVPLTKGTWQFIVSGDSRNCGDIVMPAIAAHSAARYRPSFYWHLGDLRAIYKIDEDMAGAAQKAGRPLSCDSYLKRAWPDFIEHQIAPFVAMQFYVGIGNHEVIAPKTASEFASQFEDWLLSPRRSMASEDKEPIARATSGPCGRIAERLYMSATPYYHWVRSGVDFIYLDNSTGIFPNDQLDWFDCTIERARNSAKIAAIVVGMHEALPYSRASNHGMCDPALKDPLQKGRSCESGKHVYQALLALQKTKKVYVLASHSHFYMRGIFNEHKPEDRLEGWIVGTAGAVRYPLPDGANPGPDARTKVYGYLLGTVQQNGTIDFVFQEVKQPDVPGEVSQQYPKATVSWCFSDNPGNVDPSSEETTNRCIP